MPSVDPALAAMMQLCEHLKAETIRLHDRCHVLSIALGFVAGRNGIDPEAFGRLLLESERQLATLRSPAPAAADQDQAPLFDASTLPPIGKILPFELPKD